MSGAAGRRHQSGRHSARQNLMSSLVEAINKTEGFTENAIETLQENEKFAKVIQAISNMNDKFEIVHNIINEASDGLDPRTTDCEEKLASLLEENKQLKFELDLLKGMFTKLEAENTSLRDKVTSLSAMHMKENLIIHGICANEDDENPKESVLTFLQEIMCLEVDEQSLLAARRIGKGVPDKPEIPRAIMATMTVTLRDHVLSNAKNLKDKLNDRGKPYQIKKHLPDEWNEERRQLNAQISKAKKSNEKKQEGEQLDEILVRNRTLYINKVPQCKTYLKAPKPADVFVDKMEQEKLDRIKFSTSTMAEKEGSNFQAFAIKAQSMTEIRRAYIRVRQPHPAASHIIAAYNIKNGDGYQDDREFGAGYRLADHLAANGHHNMAVFAARYRDGLNLGPGRYKLYSQVTTKTLVRIKNKS